MVAEPHDREVERAILDRLEHRAIVLLQPRHEPLEPAAIVVGHLELVEATVEVEEFWIAGAPPRQVGVALAGPARPLRRAFGLQDRLEHVGIARLDGEVHHPLGRDVDVSGGVEPVAPEPVEVDPARVVHGSEEVARLRTPERPALAVGPERMVEEFTTHDRLSKHVQRDGRLGIGVVALLDDRLAMAHDRTLPLADHVVHDVVGLAALGPRIVLPGLHREELHERVQPLVHPGPLTLVGVDDHREPEVTDLVDDHADQPPLGPLGVGAVRLRPRAVEADHRVLHPADRAVHADRDGIRVRDAVLGIDLEGMGDRLGRIEAPERLALVGPETHRHRHVAVGTGDLDAPGVPDEGRTRGPRDVADVLRPESPGPLRPAILAVLGAGGDAREFLIAEFVRQGLLGGDHEGRTIRGPGRRVTLPLRLGHHLFLVDQVTARGDHVGLGHGDRKVVVAELEGELALPLELLVLPPVVVGVRRHPREPLGDLVDRHPVVEDLVARSRPHRGAGDDRGVPVDVEDDGVPRLHRLGQVDSHHRAVDHVRQGDAVRGLDPRDLRAPVEVELLELLTHPPGGLVAPEVRRGGGEASERVPLEAVLVDLHPEIVQSMRALVVVGDGLGTFESMGDRIEPHPDVVIGPLLPVVGARGARGQPDLVRRGKQVVDLLEGIRLLVPVRHVEPHLLVQFPILVVRGIEIRGVSVDRDPGDQDAEHEGGYGCNAPEGACATLILVQSCHSPSVGGIFPGSRT